MRRRLLTLGLALAVLVAVSAWLQHRQRTAPPSVPPVVLVPSTLAVEGLTALECSVGAVETPQVRVVREPGQPWRVATFHDAPADADRVRRVVDLLRGLTGEVRATGDRWFPEFLLGEDQALRLVLRQGELVVCDLLINRSPTRSWVGFVRRRDGDVICAVDRNLLGEAAEVWGDPVAFPPSSTPWVELRLFPADPVALESVELAEFVKGTWVVRGERHAPFEGAEPQELVRAVAGQRAQAVVEDPAKTPGAFKTPRWRWTVVERSGARWALEESSAPQKPVNGAPGGPTVAVRRLPSGPELTMDADALESLRERLLPAAAQKTSAKTSKRP